MAKRKMKKSTKSKVVKTVRAAKRKSRRNPMGIDKVSMVRGNPMGIDKVKTLI